MSYDEFVWDKLDRKKKIVLVLYVMKCVLKKKRQCSII